MSRTPADGARVVARAWVDPAYKERLLADGRAAARELGIDPGPAPVLVAVENTDRVHHMVVCTLCSCYPRGLLGPPPDWYKSLPYRSRAVSDPRGVLAEFGTTLDDDVELRVLDSTADMRYLVIPRRPDGTEDLTEDELAALVTRDSMIGVVAPAAPAGVGSYPACAAPPPPRERGLLRRRARRRRRPRPVVADGRLGREGHLGAARRPRRRPARRRPVRPRPGLRTLRRRGDRDAGAGGADRAPRRRRPVPPRAQPDVPGARGDRRRARRSSSAGPRCCSTAPRSWPSPRPSCASTRSPRCSQQFGAEYEAYRRAVPGWRPRLRPWRPDQR